MLTFKGVEDQYNVNGHTGIVTSPGKFEGEPWYVVSLWDAATAGEYDYDGTIDGRPVYGFRWNQELLDELVLPDEKAGGWICLVEDDSGFVSAGFQENEPTDVEDEGDPDETLNDSDAMDIIRDELSNNEWDAATMAQVADTVRRTGREVKEVG